MAGQTSKISSSRDTFDCASLYSHSFFQIIIIGHRRLRSRNIGPDSTANAYSKYDLQKSLGIVLFLVKTTQQGMLDGT